MAKRMMICKNHKKCTYAKDCDHAKAHDELELCYFKCPYNGVHTCEEVWDF